MISSSDDSEALSSFIINRNAWVECHLIQLKFILELDFKRKSEEMSGKLIQLATLKMRNVKINFIKSRFVLADDLRRLGYIVCMVKFINSVFVEMKICSAREFR